MEEKIIEEIKRVGSILLIAIFAFTILIVFALHEKIDKLETKIEQLK